MIDSKQWELLNAAYGKAILLTHAIERRVALIIALWASIQAQGSEEVFSEKFRALCGRPFGVVLKIGINNGALSKVDAEALDQYRKVRNILIHEISDVITFRLFTKTDTDNVINELDDIVNEFSGMGNELLKNIEFLFLLAGGDLGEVKKRMDALVSHLGNLDVLALPPKGFDT